MCCILGQRDIEGDKGQKWDKEKGETGREINEGAGGERDQRRRVREHEQIKGVITLRDVKCV